MIQGGMLLPVVVLGTVVVSGVGVVVVVVVAVGVLISAEKHEPCLGSGWLATEII